MVIALDYLHEVRRGNQPVERRPEGFGTIPAVDLAHQEITAGNDGEEITPELKVLVDRAFRPARLDLC
ncbi:hypothetical protein D9M71_736670 [compost metagenome]